METLDRFITKNHITATVERADGNPNMTDMPAGSNHYRVKLRRGGKDWPNTMVVPFSMGPALTKEPTAADVLDCLASDAAGYENAKGFEDWASDYGYDPDSRKAERTYRVIERQAQTLNKFLSEPLYRALLWETERL